MKTILSALAIAAASTALAVESSNTFGILRVDSSAAQTIVSVPWEAAGGGEIKVADIVKTANLNNGDKLYYYNGSGYTMWQLTDGAWVEAQSGEGELTYQDIPRGGAIILERFAPQGGSIANCFYLYGQYTTAGSSTTCVANGYTLLAPPSTTETDLNTKTWTTPGSNDNIILQDTTVLHYRNSKWGKLTKELNRETGVITETVDPSVAKIAAGEGAWYHNDQSKDVTVQW